MLPSNSEQKSHNAKKPGRKYQKFKSKQEQGTANGIGDIKTERKNADSGEFSNMTFSEKLRLGSRCSSDKTIVPGAIKENKKLNVDVPGLRNYENLQKNEKDLSKGEDKLSPSTSRNDHSVLTKTNIEAGIENKSHKETKAVTKVNSSKTSAEPYRNPYKKKRSDPLFISFQDILSSRRTSRKTRNHNIHKIKALKLRNKELLSGNLLDSSNPKRSRGKHREIKKKKLSNLKLTIIKERIIKQKIKAMGADAHVEWTSLVDKIDFNTEIKAYLSELNSKKLKNSQNSENTAAENLKQEKIPKEEQILKEEQKDVENVVKKEESLGITEIKLEEKEKDLKNVVCKFKGKSTPQISGKEEIKFSSKFREYCDNFITPELNSAVAELIKGLINLQDRLFLRDPIKAKVKKRHVSGFREVRKYLILKRVKMIIIAPNLEKLQMEGSIYDSIEELKSMADGQNVPYGFALDRYKLGRCTKKNVPVSAFAVLSYDGIESLYDNALHQLKEAKKNFSDQAKAAVKNESEDENSKIISSIISTLREGLYVSEETQLQHDGL